MKLIFPKIYAGILMTLALVCFQSIGHTQEDLSVSIATNASTSEVILTWSTVDDYNQFNLYRKSGPGSVYPETPLNGENPITIFTDCDDIISLIPIASTEWRILQAISGNEDEPFEPCMISGIPQGSTEYERLQLLVRGNWRIAMVAGQGYRDQSTTNGVNYLYEIRGVDDEGVEGAVLATDLSVIAGSPVLPPPPATLGALPGDSQVMVLWDDVDSAAGFNVYRSTNPAGPFTLQVNSSSFITRIAYDFDGDPLPDPSNGFIDFKRWDEFGVADTHDVNGIPVAGPHNGTTYYYKVASIDILNQQGTLSGGTASATPVDQTPPMTPQEIVVTANDPLDQLELRWAIVTKDVDGHLEPTISGYRVFRYDDPDSDTPVQVGGIFPQPAAGIQYATAIDSDPVLRPQFGEQTFWYRIECIDGNGNVGSRSAVASGYLNDLTPPAHPRGLHAEGHEEFIRVFWQPNNEPDLDGYLIYRSLCDFGLWVCDPRNEKQRSPNTYPDVAGVPYDRKDECPEVFKLIGYLSREEAEALAADAGGEPYFDDSSVPAGSPLCYAYLIKAIDESQNQNGTLPPDIIQEEIVCQRLRDRTPPEAAIITELSARDHSIIVGWVGAPVQDIAAYHVYRAEKEEGPYSFVGGMTVPIPPAPPVELTDPYEPPDVVGCNTIALQIQEYMSVGQLIDKKVDPKQIYWYKVVGIDQNGNEGKFDDAVGVSTFTYSTATPIAPAISSIDETSPDCALLVQWNPPYNGSQHKGFIVFRSTTSPGGPYRQISGVITDNEYLDKSVIKGVEYFYQILLLDVEGTHSNLSAPMSGTPNP